MKRAILVDGSMEIVITTFFFLVPSFVPHSVFHWIKYKMKIFIKNHENQKVGERLHEHDTLKTTNRIGVTKTHTYNAHKSCTAIHESAEKFYDEKQQRKKPPSFGSQHTKMKNNERMQ